MSVIFITAILVGGILALCFLFISIAKRHKRKAMNHLLYHFSELGTLYALSFSSHEVLNDCIIGLDGVQGKLLIMSVNNETAGQHEVIELKEVKACSLRKYYGNIQPQALKSRPLDHHLQKMVLHFEMMGATPKEVTFYHHTADAYESLKELHTRAGHWETLLSKMLHFPNRRIA